MNVQCSSFGCGKRLVAGSICKYFAHQTILSIKTREMRLWKNVLMNRSIIDDYPPYRITSLCDTGSFPCHSVKINRADGKKSRSEERRVGKEWVSQCSTRWWQKH